MDVMAVGALVQWMIHVLTNILLVSVLIRTLGSIAKQGCAGSEVVNVAEGQRGCLAVIFQSDLIEVFRKRFENCIDAVCGLAALMALDAQVRINGFQIAFVILLGGEGEFGAAGNGTLVTA